MSLGPRRANSYFWKAPTKHPTWFDVQQRIEHLAIEHPAEVDHFVLEALTNTADPITMAGMARHPSSASIVATWLLQINEQRATDLSARLEGNRMLGGAVAGSARLLLPAHIAQTLLDWVTDLYQLPDDRMFQFMDSMGVRLSQQCTDDADSDRARVGHRLIISESLADREALAVLLPGADKTTLLAVDDTFGRADFDDYLDWPGVGSLIVEHVRTRITRFSQEYIDLHTSTALVAGQVVSTVAEVPGLIRPEDIPSLEVEVADFLFFQSLKVSAIERLLADQSFDHIVLATASQSPDGEFITLMSGIDGLSTDPRVEVVSASRSSASRAQFWSVLENLVTLPPSPHLPLRWVEEDVVLRKFDELARRTADDLESFPPTTRPWVPVVTANNQAYNASTASYVADLAQEYDTRVLHVGRNAVELAEHIAEAMPGRSTVSIDFLAPSVGFSAPLARLLARRLRSQFDDSEAATPPDRLAAWALRSSVQRLCTDAIAPALGRFRILRHWFSSMDSAGELPAAIVLTPQRHVGVGATAAIARAHGVPTIVVEPHAQDANYCRYVKISADFYGVMSDYFRTQTAEAFGAGSERTRTIGSPRQVAPTDYDPVSAQAIARAEFHQRFAVEFPHDRTALVFFGQPSSWEHVSAVWSNVLQAASRTNSIVLLKPHPEETATRRRQYIDIAHAHTMRDDVVLIDGDADTAIALADIVLTAYSTAGIDAAIRQSPVVSVTNGDVAYPLDLSRIVGASFASSVNDIVAVITAFETDPAAARATSQALLEREDQFVSGPGKRLRELVQHSIDLGPAALRCDEHLPSSLFLDGPHPVYPV